MDAFSTTLNNDSSFNPEEITDADLENLPEMPSFPVFMIGMATAKDLLDLASMGMLGWVISIFFGSALGIWMFRKVGTMNKFMLRRLIRKFFGWKRIVTFMIGWIPVVGAFVPESIILVLLSHFSEKKSVEEFLAIVRQLEMIV